jgi:hypothetical protein
MTKVEPRPLALLLNLGQTQIVFNKLISQVLWKAFQRSMSPSRVAVSPISNSIQLMLQIYFFKIH